VKAPDSAIAASHAEDLAILTGGQVISEEVGRKLDTVTPADLGRCRKVVADKDNCTVVEGKGSEDKIKARMKQIKARSTRLL